MKSDLRNCSNCGVDLVEVFGDATAKPKATTFVCAETEEIIIIESTPWNGPARCLCGADLPPPKR